MTMSMAICSEGLKIVDGLDPNAVAYATYNDTVNENGYVLNALSVHFHICVHIVDGKFWK